MLKSRLKIRRIKGRFEVGRGADEPNKPIDEPGSFPVSVEFYRKMIKSLTGQMNGYHSVYLNEISGLIQRMAELGPEVLVSRRPHS